MDDKGSIIVNIALAVFSLVFIPLFSAKHKRKQGAQCFAALCALMAAGFVCVALTSAAMPLPAQGKVAALLVGYAITPFWAVTLLLYALYSLLQERYVRAQSLGVVMILPVVTALLTATNPLHGWLFQIGGSSAAPVLEGFGAWHFISSAYTLCLYVYGFIIITDKNAPRQGSYRVQALAYLLPTAATIAAFVCDLMKWAAPFPHPVLYAVFVCAGLTLVCVVADKEWEYQTLARSKVFENLGFPVVVLDAAGNVVDYNPEAAVWLRRLEEDVRGRPFAQVKIDMLVEWNGAHFNHGGLSGITLSPMDGECKYYSLETREFEHQQRRVGSYIIFSDITSAQEHIEQLNTMASLDQLTGLYNRRMCDLMLKDLDVPENYPLAVMIGDVNDLKGINDEMGHEAGDEAIRAAAEVLQRYLPDDGFAGRLGGDEFLIVLPCMNERGCEMYMKLVHQRCLHESEKRDLPLSISLGYAAKTEGAQDISQIKSQADKNMYSAKQKYKRETGGLSSWYA